VTLREFSDWLAEGIDAYLSWYWPTWRAQTATHSGQNLISVMRQIWHWLDRHRYLQGWEGLRRADLEEWVEDRNGQDIDPQTTLHYLVMFRMLLRFLKERDYPIREELFRVMGPRRQRRRLPAICLSWSIANWKRWS